MQALLDFLHARLPKFGIALSSDRALDQVADRLDARALEAVVGADRSQRRRPRSARSPHALRDASRLVSSSTRSGSVKIAIVLIRISAASRRASRARSNRPRPRASACRSRSAVRRGPSRRCRPHGGSARRSSRSGSHRSADPRSSPRRRVAAPTSSRQVHLELGQLLERRNRRVGVEDLDPGREVDVLGRISPGAVATSGASTSSASVCMRTTTSLRLRTMSVTSSLTPGTVENSCATPSIRTLLITAPPGEESSTRRSEFPNV